MTCMFTFPSMMPHCGDSLALVVVLRPCLGRQLRKPLPGYPSPTPRKDSQCTQEHDNPDPARHLGTTSPYTSSHHGLPICAAFFPSVLLCVTTERKGKRSETNKGKPWRCTPWANHPNRRSVNSERAEILGPQHPGPFRPEDIRRGSRKTLERSAVAPNMALRRGSSLAGLVKRGLGQLQSELSSAGCSVQAEGSGLLNG